MINRKRIVVFASILSLSIAIDMISTYLLIKSGYKELTGLIVLMIDTSSILLIIWVIIWWFIIYFSYRFLEKIHLNIHIETITLYYAIMSLLAGIGNFYLYYKEILM